MINPDDIENGQVFQPFANNVSELIRCMSGRWERSIDDGKSYGYTPAMQEKNKADALAPESMRIIKPVINRLSGEEYRAYIEDQKNPLLKRNSISVNNKVSLIFANEGVLDHDIENALLSCDPQMLLLNVRSLLLAYQDSITSFDFTVYVSQINNKISSIAEKIIEDLPHLAQVLRFGIVPDVQKQITALINTGADNQQPSLDSQQTNKVEQNKFDAQPKLNLAVDVAPPSEKINYIKSDAQEILMSSLSPYVEPEQHKSLSLLVKDSQKQSSPILCNCKQVVLMKIFYDLLFDNSEKDWQINCSKRDLSIWICSNFLITEEGKYKTPTYSTVLRYLSGKGFPQYK